jgi:CDP-4-dehydro-6-deoxyglucose reductase
VQQIVLRLTDTHSSTENQFVFQAGQYLEIIHPDGTAIPLSIASSPLLLPDLHLHYQSMPGAQEASLLDGLLATAQTLTIRGPAGEVYVEAAETRSLLLICGGTGTSQALSIIQDTQLRGSNRRVTLLACADTDQGFYFRPLLESLGADWLETAYRADATRTPENLGMRWLAENVQRHADRRIIVCGSPPFVYAAADVLVAAGIATAALESDVFAYSPRTD